MSTTAHAALDPRTPVIVGVGQAVERIEDAGYVGISAADLAAHAAEASAGRQRGGRQRPRADNGRGRGAHV